MAVSMAVYASIVGIVGVMLIDCNDWVEQTIIVTEVVWL